MNIMIEWRITLQLGRIPTCIIMLAIASCDVTSAIAAECYLASSKVLKVIDVTASSQSDGSLKLAVSVVPTYYSAKVRDQQKGLTEFSGNFIFELGTIKSSMPYPIPRPDSPIRDDAPYIFTYSLKKGAKDIDLFEGNTSVQGTACVRAYTTERGERVIIN